MMRIHVPQVNQYQNFEISFNGKEYKVPSPECEVAGPGCKIPSGENVADKGAGRAGFRAYQHLPDEEKLCVPGFNFTSDQLFWVNIPLWTHLNLI